MHHRSSRLTALVLTTAALLLGSASTALGHHKPDHQGGPGSGNNGNGSAAAAPAAPEPAPAPAPAASTPASSAPATPAKPTKPAKPGGTQGNSPSDPDGASNGGADKPGSTGGSGSDQDGNNGCGNDDDREDDNNGNCGGGGAKPANGKVTICHATGSAKNPYVRITISVNGLNGHRRHAGDIIPAPAGGCPTPDDQPQAPGVPGSGGTTPGGGSGPGGGTPTTETSIPTLVSVLLPGVFPGATGAGAAGTQREATEDGATADSDGNPTAVAGVSTGPEAEDEFAEVAAVEELDQDANLGGLPFTGQGLATTIALGLLLLVIGAAVWRRSHRTPARSTDAA